MYKYNIATIVQITLMQLLSFPLRLSHSRLPGSLTLPVFPFTLPRCSLSHG